MFVQTLTSCVSAQASWPENCPCAKRKRVKQTPSLESRSEDREVRNHPAEKLANYKRLNSVHQDSPHISISLTIWPNKSNKQNKYSSILMLHTESQIQNDCISAEFSIGKNYI